MKHAILLAVAAVLSVFLFPAAFPQQTPPPDSAPLLYPPTYDQCRQAGKPVVTRKDIYHEGWIDLNKNGRKDVYEDPSQPEDKRLDDLVRQMSLEEKTVQCATLYGYRRVLKDYLPTQTWRTSDLWKDGIANIDEHLNGYPYYNQNVPGAAWLWPASKHTWALNEVQRFFIEDTRLGIPVEFTDEGIRGVEHTRATLFPTQLAMGSTWDRALVRRAGEITGREGFVLGYDNVYSPIADVMRDPRWGRCLESYGEDPYLVSELAIQQVLGVQSQGVASTLKHFAVYANNKGAREGQSRTDPGIAPREMEMLHLWPVQRIIRAANPLGVMSSYNDYDGIPVTGSHYFLTDVLRRRMGFQGYVVSDSDAVEFLFRKHHVAADYKDAVRQSILAGLNVRTTFKPPDEYVLPLRELVREGAVPIEVLDSRVRDVLRVKMREGLFDKPYRPLDNADSVVMSAPHLAAARQASRESVVLLKNAGAFLPLDPAKMTAIAVSGPNADNVHHSLGRYGPGDVPVTTVRKALESRFAGKARVLYSPGAGFFDEKWPDTEIFHDPPSENEQRLIDEAVAQARQADVAVVVVGDQYNGVPNVRGTVGEDASRTSIDLTGRQDDLIRAIAATGKPMVIVDISGRPVALNVANRYARAIVQAFLPGAYGGESIADVLFGDYNPGGKLPCTFPKTTGQLEMNFPTKPGANAEQTGAKRLSVTGVLWPFGHGLSYTSFQYANLRVSPPRGAPTTDFTVSFDVTNTGRREGDEIPQLYIRDLVSSTITWEQSLRGFERIHLKPGETRTVKFTLTPDLLSLWNPAMQWVVEPGRFEAQVGASSADIRLKAGFEIEAAPAPAAGPQTIKPGELWPDDRGQHIQAHGGGILKLGDTWYWFGEDRSQGLDRDKRYVSCYSSKDLAHWTFRNRVIQLADPENFGRGWVLERPKVFYNAQTRKFVMYMHIDGNTAEGSYKIARVGVAVSGTVDGDYQYLKSFRPLGHESRDIGQFVDDDGSAYLIFEDRPFGFRIARLSADYLSVEKEMCLIPAHMEGGAIVHYQGLYYAIGSALTGWSPNPNKYATAKSLEGPWSEFQDIAPPETKTYGSQSTLLLKVVGTKTTSVIFMGDIWKPRTQWDSRYLWMPVQIGEGKLRLPEPKPWTLDVVTGVAVVP